MELGELGHANEVIWAPLDVIDENSVVQVPAGDSRIKDLILALKALQITLPLLPDSWMLDRQTRISERP